MSDCDDRLDPSLLAMPMPGPRGQAGAAGTGTQGPAGVNAFTTTSASFVQPAVGASVDVSVVSTAWIAVGQPLFVETAGFYTVHSILTPTSVRLTRQDISGYAATSATVTSGKKVSPAGFAVVDNGQYAGLNARVTALEAAVPATPLSTFRQATPPSAPIAAGSLWFDTDDGDKMYRWDGSAWVEVTAQIDLDPFGTGIRPIQVLGSLPVSGMIEGDVVFLTTDKKLYRYTGSAWTSAVAAGDLVGTLPNGAIAANYIVAGMIGAGVINSTHVGANQIVTQAANIADAVIGDAKIASLSASKIQAGTVTGHIIQIAGAGGAVRSSNYVAGATGWNIDGLGNAEFNAVTVRGQLRASLVTNDSAVANPSHLNSSFPTAATQSGSNGSARGTLGAGGTVTELVTFYGWGTGTGFANDRFGKSTTTFLVSASGGYTVASGSFADTELVYRVNGGSWVQINPIAARNLDSDGFFNISRPVTISGLAAGDNVQFGVRHKAPNNATTINFVDLSVIAFNF